MHKLGLSMLVPISNKEKQKMHDQGVNAAAGVYGVHMHPSPQKGAPSLERK